MKKLMNKCLNISKVTLLLLVAIVLYSIMLLAGTMNNEDLTDIVPLNSIDSSKTWQPTKEDIAYQDSMYSIIERTSMDVDTIKEAIDIIIYKLERIEHVDGTYDSIRYIEGSVIDKRRNNN